MSTFDAAEVIDFGLCGAAILCLVGPRCATFIAHRRRRGSSAKNERSSDDGVTRLEAAHPARSSRGRTADKPTIKR
jgi:hypothetical protein